MSSILPWMYVGLGGAAGSILRAVLARWQPWPGVPVAILLANVLGSFAIGLLWGWLAQRDAASGVLWNALGVGLLGGFTTYSSYSLDVLRLLESGRVGMALFYAVSTLVLALLACWAGLVLSR